MPSRPAVTPPGARGVTLHPPLLLEPEAAGVSETPPPSWPRPTLPELLPDELDPPLLVDPPPELPLDDELPPPELPLDDELLPPLPLPPWPPPLPLLLPLLPVPASSLETPPSTPTLPLELPPPLPPSSELLPLWQVCTLKVMYSVPPSGPVPVTPPPP
jgi:hypothetical protein